MIVIVQLKDMVEILHQGVYKNDAVRPIDSPNGVGSHSGPYSILDVDHQSRFNVNSALTMLSFSTSDSTLVDGNTSQNHTLMNARESNKLNLTLQDSHVNSNGMEEDFTARQRDSNAEKSSSGSKTDIDNKEIENPPDGEMVYKSPSPISSNIQVEAEWIEQYEPGVYITLVALRDGTRDLKRVRFR